MSKVLEISNYILDYLESSNVSVSNLKLQKLLMGQRPLWGAPVPTATVKIY